MVPTHSNRFASDFGKAEMPGEEDIIKVISSFPSLFVTLPAPSAELVVVAALGEIRGGASDEESWSMFGITERS